MGNCVSQMPILGSRVRERGFSMYVYISPALRDEVHENRERAPQHDF